MRRVVVRAAVVALVFATQSFAYRISIWIPPWDSAALSSIQQQGGKIDESNPVWYNLASDGSIVRNWNAESPTWRAAMSGELIPTIQNFVDGRFNGALVASIVDDPISREAHAEAITRLAVAQAFDGIDIDYESVPETSRAGFTQFVTLLASKLHGTGKKLSVTVHAKTSDRQNWKGPGAQDWAAIGQVADSVKIMAYDYHWPGSTAGPITPLDWLEKVASYATSAMDARKVVIGLPWYGYDWIGTSAENLTYAEAISLAASKNATVARDANGEATFSYASHTVFFQDAESYKRKVDLLVQKFSGIGGFAHWRTGVEDPAIWNEVGELRGQGSVGATPATPDFSITGPSRLELQAGQSASASYSVVPLNGFNSSITPAAQPIDPFPGNAAFTRTSVDAGMPAEFRVTTGLSTPSGAYRMILRFSAGTRTRETFLTVEVKPAPEIGDFDVTGPANVTVRSGKPAIFSYGITPRDGFDRTVAVQVEKIDFFAGSLALSATTISPHGASGLNITADPRALPGTYRIRLRFTSGSNVHERIIAVTILSVRNRSARR